ncbi:MAG: hypothetical protein H3C62_05225 [Gemmatimonadaceae bacterium]|nr:hypothetical protein [Gemmatimonadaceae bacterium]
MTIRTGVFLLEGRDPEARWESLLAWADAMAREQQDTLAVASQVGPFLPGFTARAPQAAQQGYTVTRLGVKLPTGHWYALDYHALLQLAALLGLPSDVVQRGLERQSRALTTWMREEFAALGDVTHRWRLDGAVVRAILSNVYGPLDSHVVLRELRRALVEQRLHPVRVVHAPHRHRIEFARDRDDRSASGLRAGLVLTNSEVAEAALTLAPAVVGGRFTSRLEHPDLLELRHTLHAATRLVERVPAAVPALCGIADDAVARWLTHRHIPVREPDPRRWQQALEPALGKPLAAKVLSQWAAQPPAEQTLQTLFHAVAEAARSLNDTSASLDIERLLTVVLYPEVDARVAADAGVRAREAEPAERRPRRGAAAAFVA